MSQESHESSSIDEELYHLAECVDDTPCIDSGTEYSICDRGKCSRPSRPFDRCLNEGEACSSVFNNRGNTFTCFEGRCRENCQAAANGARKVRDSVFVIMSQEPRDVSDCKGLEYFDGTRCVPLGGEGADCSSFNDACLPGFSCDSVKCAPACATNILCASGNDCVFGFGVLGYCGTTKTDINFQVRVAKGWLYTSVGISVLVVLFSFLCFSVFRQYFSRRKYALESKRDKDEEESEENVREQSDENERRHSIRGSSDNHDKREDVSPPYDPEIVQYDPKEKNLQFTADE